MRDIGHGTTEIVSVNNQGQPSANGASSPSISADGRLVGFQAGRSNLTSTDSNRFVDVFVHDRNEHTTNQVTVSSIGEPGDDHSGGPAMSGNGSVIAFWSYATNLVLRAEYEQSIVVHYPR